MNWVRHATVAALIVAFFGCDDTIFPSEAPDLGSEKGWCAVEKVFRDELPQLPLPGRQQPGRPRPRDRPDRRDGERRERRLRSRDPRGAW